MSAAVAEVVELLGQLTTGGAIQRGRAAVQAAHVIGRLTGEQKRQLAIDVAERVAPHLVPRIEAETGKDLTPAQVSALLDMFKRMDADQVAELSRAVRDRDASSAAVQEVVSGAMAVAGLETVAAADDQADADPPEGASAQSEPAETEADTDSAHAAALAEADAERRRALAQAEAEREAALARAEAERDAALAEAEATAARAVEQARRKAARVASAVGGATASVASRLRRSGGGDAATPSLAEPPNVHTDHAFTDLDLDWDFHLPSPAAAALAARTASSSDTTGGGPTAPAVADVATFPEGFRRRRAAQAAIREGRVGAADAAALCRLFERAGDRAWVAADLVERSLLSVATLHELLPDRTARRLAARLDRVA